MKRLIQKLVHRALNSAFQAGTQISLPAPSITENTDSKGPQPMAVEIAKTRTVQLPGDGRGSITYRIPTVIEQLRFHAASKWFEEKDYLLRAADAIAALPPYIVSVNGGYYASFDEVLADRANTDVLMDVSLDVAGKKVPAAEKKQ